MKRDMDLIRELMLKLEALPIKPGDTWLLRPGMAEIQVANFSSDEVTDHVRSLNNAGFIETGGIDAMDGTGFKGLTWAGQDFLDSVRSPDVWDKTKKVASAAGGFTVDLLVATAKSYLEAKIKGLIGG